MRCKCSIKTVVVALCNISRFRKMEYFRVHLCLHLFYSSTFLLFVLGSDSIISNISLLQTSLPMGRTLNQGQLWTALMIISRYLAQITTSCRVVIFQSGDIGLAEHPMKCILWCGDRYVLSCYFSHIFSSIARNYLHFRCNLYLTQADFDQDFK